ncbi:ABC transporter permease [Paenibacillus filicis]|uniref:ABC transporter permease n=1 Tax=Paenibacillus gyeongsangnamensis TaxID=3388067 RepID=A0ABT4QEK7_9BACL|nr:ABC transporter permease [Paenibacillus filicis]MCZ8515227.1 ABC transporter permease [Paenibacillus filicis]
MGNYALRRILNAVPILLGITMISFLIIHMAPGSPLSHLLDDPSITAADRENMMQAYGLDQPLYIQYWQWLSGMVRGDFGTSFIKHEPVIEIILSRLPYTLLLTLSAFLVAIVIAVPLGVLCAVKAHSRLDQIVSAITFVGTSTPVFWFGLLLIMFFSVKLGWLPSGGLMTINAPFSLSDRILHLIMPVCALASHEIAYWLRYVRSSMLEVINQDYVRTARAKGLLNGRVLMLHGLRNALIPLATLLGLSLPTFFAGALITESIFSIPGMGRLFIEAAFQRDYPVIFGITTIGAFLHVFGNLLADLLYAVLDPRVSFSQKGV